MNTTWKEERANAVSHGIGAVLSVAALVAMLVYAIPNGDPLRIISCAVFGSTLIILYVSSTLLHSARTEKWIDIFEIMDHAAIFLLIAGTYTPFLMVSLQGTLGYSLMGVVWGLALAGVIFKLFYVKRFMVLSTLFYVVMGWLIVIAIRPLYEVLPERGMLWLVAGGLLYTFGTIFYLWRRIPYHHAIWHSFVLLGSICHFITVFFYVLPK